VFAQRSKRFDRLAVNEVAQRSITKQTMNDATSEKPAASSPPSAKSDSDFTFDSSEQKTSPRLSHRGLTIMLALMCLVPVVTIFVLWKFLPPVIEGELEAHVYAEGLPSAEFYADEYYDRPPFAGGVLVVENRGDLDWTHLINIQVNRHYQIYDSETFPAHSVKRYELDRFLNRTGARFSLRYNELKSVRIYARRPTKDRATYYREFETHEKP
jgi:hypothetical protein